MAGNINNFTATIYKYYEPGVRIVENINGTDNEQIIIRSLVSFVKNITYVAKKEKSSQLMPPQKRHQI